MKKIPVSLIAGIAALSAVMGLFIGASNSPITGLMITGLFGIIASLFGLGASKKKDEVSSASPVPPLQTIGQLMIVFSIFVLLGAFAGERYRLHEKTTDKFLVWTGKPAPTSTYEALDWIAVTETLTAKGYAPSQVDSLYTIRLRELSDTANYNAETNGLRYSESTPYSRMLEKIPAKEARRGLASEE